jgi:hypothetical protein
LVSLAVDDLVEDVVLDEPDFVAGSFVFEIDFSISLPSLSV